MATQPLPTRADVPIADRAANGEPRPRYLEQELERLERIVSIGVLLNSTLNLPLLLQTITRTAAELLGTEGVSILLGDERTGELFFAAAADTDGGEIMRIKVPISGSIAGAVYRSGEPSIVNDVREDERHFAGVDEGLRFETRSILAVPLQVRGRRIGVLEAINKQSGAAFEAGDTHLLTTLASYAAVAIENSRLVSRLSDANRRLSKLDQVKSNFISIASHELRTPLMIVQGYASYLRDQASSGISQDLDRVLQGARQLQVVIDQMTNLSYLEAGLSEPQMGDCDLRDLIGSVVGEWRALAAAKSVQLELTTSTRPVLVRADQGRIALALNSLLDNAVKFTPQGGSVSVALSARTGYALISVADTGIGIPADQLGLIFDSFYQVEDHLTRHYGGLGLGLTIARQAVEQHGGKIWAESTQGQGSRFYISLPTCAAADG